MQFSVRESTRYAIRAAGLIWQSSPRWSAINLLILILRGALPLLLIWVIKLLIDRVTLGTDTTNALEQIWIPFTLAALFFMLHAVLSSAQTLIREKQSHLVNDYITGLIHGKTAHIRYGYFEDAAFQDIFYRAINESAFRPARIFYGIAGILQSSFTLLLLGLIWFTIHWALLPAAVVLSSGIIWYRISHSRQYYRLLREQTEDERRVHYFNRVITAKEYAKEVRIFDLGGLFTENYRKLRDSLRQKQLTLLWQKTIRETAFQLLISLAMVMLFVYILIQTLHGHFTAGSMAMYLMAIYRSYGLLQDLLSRITGLYEDNLFLKNFFEFLEIKTDDGADMQLPFPRPLQRGIEFKEVSFHYPGTTRKVLENISFTISRGETVAIVGANGSGKSTLIKLLCGLYEPTRGEIRMDNTPLHHISRKSMAESVTVIFQDFMLYNVSALENIWFGNIHRQPQMEEIEKAARKADIHTVFRDLPKGYDTQLGTLFTHSEQLSQGEWQRTALARSFFNHAEVIVLDEPTSSLDAFTEAQLIRNFKQITAEKTAILISHRLSTLRIADRILVLQDHRLVEQGTADELLQLNGTFARMMRELENWPSEPNA